MQKVAVIGMGYVGIPIAALLADAGYDVTGIQRQSARSGWKIDWLNAGRCPIGGNEPELPQLLSQAVSRGNFRVRADYASIKDCDLILIDVQTPTDSNHIPQYQSLKEACHQIGPYLSLGKVVIIESTVAPGTTQYLVKPLLEAASGLKAGLSRGFGLCFSYERVMVGRLIHNIRHYPKIIGGIDDASSAIAADMYRRVVQAGVYQTDPMTAEVAKTVENAYRDVQIAFANEVALLCEALKIDVYEVRRFVNGLPDDPSMPHANPVRNMHLPGAGVGGHCLPKDTWLLMHGYRENAKVKIQKSQLQANSKDYPYPVSILEGARYLNDWMPVHMVDLLESALKEAGKNLKGATIGILGYAFLENSDDSRNTPTVPLIEELIHRGAGYRIHDPYVRKDGDYPIDDNLDKVLKDCDGIALMTRHEIYQSIEPERLKRLLRTKVIVDGRNAFNGSRYIAEGFIFRGVGKGNLNGSD